MTREHLEQIFEEQESNNVENNIFYGLMILAKYTKEELVGAAEHDIIYSVDINSVLPDLTEQDAIALSNYGWMIDETDCFSHFV